MKVFATFQFEGFHQWVDAPPEVEYLRDLHRHIFHVRMEKRVSHADRDVEFITLKKAGQKLVAERLEKGNTQRWSCEMWAIYLLTSHLRLDACEVSEDGENGSLVTRALS